MTDTTIISTSELERLKIIEAEYHHLKHRDMACKCLEMARVNLLHYLSTCNETTTISQIRRMAKTFLGDKNETLRVL